MQIKKIDMAKSRIFNLMPGVSNIGPKERVRALFPAEKILKHEFEILGSKIRFKKKINWHTNFSNKNWPREPHDKFLKNTFVIGSPKYIGDIKLPWELSKHLHFQELAKAYLLTSDEKYVDEFIYQIENWLKENPYGAGVNWAQGLIVGQRAISWIISLGTFQNSSRLEDSLLQKITNSLSEHAMFIAKNYEIRPRATNHLLGELCSVIIVDTIFPEFDRSRSRLKKARKLLEEQLMLQVYPDGVDYEKSTSYQRYVLEFFFLMLILEKRGELQLSRKLKQTIEKMSEFLMWMAQPSGNIQPISDADGARVFILGNEINDVRPHLAIASWLFERPDFKFAAAKIYSPALWFLSQAENQQLNQIKPVPPKASSKEFEAGGYWILRKNWNKNSPWLFFDCGLMGQGPWPEDLALGVHGHSDILNFGLALGDETFLTDLGSYSYTTDFDFHQYFRSAPGHNTPIIDGEDQNIIEPRYWMSRQTARPQNPTSYFSYEYDYLAGEHTGYLRLKGKIITKREILYAKKRNFIIIKDSFLGEGHHKITENFHLMPGLSIKRLKDGFLIRGKTKNLVIQSLSHGEHLIVKGKDLPPSGWYSPDYGKKVKTPELRFEIDQCFPSQIYFLLDWSGKTQNFLPIELFEEVVGKVRKPVLAIVGEAKISKKIDIAYKAILIDPEDIETAPFNLTALKGYLGRKIINFYFKFGFFTVIFSYFGGIKKILTVKTNSWMNQGLDKPVMTKDAPLSFWQLVIGYEANLKALRPEVILTTNLAGLVSGWLTIRHIPAKLIYQPESKKEQAKNLLAKFFEWLIFNRAQAIMRKRSKKNAKA